MLTAICASIKDGNSPGRSTCVQITALTQHIPRVYSEGQMTAIVTPIRDEHGPRISWAHPYPEGTLGAYLQLA